MKGMCVLQLASLIMYREAQHALWFKSKSFRFLVPCYVDRKAASLYHLKSNHFS